MILSVITKRLLYIIIVAISFMGEMAILCHRGLLKQLIEKNGKEYDRNSSIQHLKETELLEF